MHNKVKEEQMKEKGKPKTANATKESSLEAKMAKRISNGNKLITELLAAKNPAPYADSILAAAKYSKLRILEAFVSYYSDDQGHRANKINETDLATGRCALHYLAYMGNDNLIQLLGATDGMKMNILDAYDRTCMHYAAIRGGSTAINTIFLLFKSHGGAFKRAELDPNAAPEPKSIAKDDVDVINDEI
jgi:ankyrin repeat protein